jgi:hypothetical protein
LFTNNDGKGRPSTFATENRHFSIESRGRAQGVPDTGSSYRRGVLRVSTPWVREHGVAVRFGGAASKSGGHRVHAR